VNFPVSTFVARYNLMNGSMLAPPLSAAMVRRGAGYLLRREGGDGQKLAYVYFEDEPGRRSAAKLLTRDEAGRIDATLEKQW
jgi:hypothetical protein